MDRFWNVLRTARSKGRRTKAQAIGSTLQGLLIASLLLGVTMNTSAQRDRSARFTIRLEEVVDALHAAKLPLEGATVRLLAQNSATADAPRLEIKGVEPWGERSARVRIRCEAQEQCLPFYVAVDWSDATLAKAALRAGGPMASSQAHSSTIDWRLSGPAPLGRPAGKSGYVSLEAKRGSYGAEAGGVEANVHAGSRATLVIDGQRVHIKLPVICLEDGAPGATVRVTGLDRKQKYLAEVIDSTLLKGTLEGTFQER